jgi:hypothetical protein
MILLAVELPRRPKFTPVLGELINEKLNGRLDIFVAGAEPRPPTHNNCQPPLMLITFF